MKVLFDTNVVLDVLLDREPFSEPASVLFSKVERGEIEGFVCATTLTTIYYLVSKAINRSKADECIDLLLRLFKVSPVDRKVIETARELKFKDFEDAVICASALHSGCKAIITRNLKDFSRSTLLVYLPDEFLKVIQEK